MVAHLTEMLVSNLCLTLFWGFFGLLSKGEEVQG